MLTDEAWALLQQVPKGGRSEFVSQAVITELTLRRRREAAARMDKLRESMQPLPGSTEEWIREDRDNHD